MQQSQWSIQTRRVCYDCGEPIQDEETQICPVCRSKDIDDRRARPQKPTSNLITGFPFPWTKQGLRKGSTIVLSGNAGSGKTSSCIMLKPKKIMTTEQEVKEVAHAWYRLQPDLPSPVISHCSTLEDLEEDVAELGEGEIGVVDSISQFADGPEASRIVKNVIEKVRAQGSMLVFIAQFTKGGDMKGPNMVNHMVDVICQIPDDPLGLRQLKALKNRLGGLWSQYFTFNEKGHLVEQPFEYAYTVEGSAGRYRLHLHGMGGAKLDGIFKDMSAVGIHLEGMASAGVSSPGYKSGFAEPPDVLQRRIFAEDHGLKWICPETANTMIQEQLETQQ